MSLSLAAGAAFSVAGENTSGATVEVRLEPALPKTWFLVERKVGALPQGHYWGQEYAGARGEEIVLQGSTDVHVAWQDAGGAWHTDAVGKEALRLYVMPPNYRESLMRFLFFKRPVAARLLVETPSFKVYAHASARVIETEKLDRIAKHGRAIRWPDSPETTGTLSWSTWSIDIPKLFAEKK